jgi:hypothetical protein
MTQKLFISMLDEQLLEQQLEPEEDFRYIKIFLLVMLKKSKVNLNASGINRATLAA